MSEHKKDSKSGPDPEQSDEEESTDVDNALELPNDLELLPSTSSVFGQLARIDESFDTSRRPLWFGGFGSASAQVEMTIDTDRLFRRFSESGTESESEFTDALSHFSGQTDYQSIESSDTPFQPPAPPPTPNPPSQRRPENPILYEFFLERECKRCEQPTGISHWVCACRGWSGIYCIPCLRLIILERQEGYLDPYTCPDCNTRFFGLQFIYDYRPFYRLALSERTGMSLVCVTIMVMVVIGIRINELGMSWNDIKSGRRQMDSHVRTLMIIFFVLLFGIIGYFVSWTPTYLRQEPNKIIDVRLNLQNAVLRIPDQ